jgi:hypothetical protein
VPRDHVLASLAHGPEDRVQVDRGDPSAIPPTTAASSETSTACTSTSPPYALSRASAAAFFSGFIPQITTLAPAWARPSAMPRPMPPLPPVIRATFPVRSKGLYGIGGSFGRRGR